MLPEVLSNVQSYLSTLDFLTQDEVLILLSHLKSYRKDKFIYPGTLRRVLNIPMSKVYSILFALEKIGVITQNFEPYCHACNRFYDEIFSSLAEIPDDVNCPICRQDLDLAKDIIVIFKVIV